MPTKYDKDVKAKAIRLVRDHAGDYDTEWAAIREISARLGMSGDAA
jgi:transposase